MKSPITELPTEVLLIIFSFVKGYNILTLLRVCKRWRLVCAQLTVKCIEWYNGGNINLNDFNVMLGKFGKINSITLECSCSCTSNRVSNWDIIRLIDSRQNLISLNIFHCDKMTDVWIKRIGEGCPQLQSLDIYGCDNVTNVGIMKIVEVCPRLQELSLGKCYEVTDVGITKIGEGCPQLRSLDLSDCWRVSDVGITKIAEGCPQLQSLNLCYCDKVTDVGITKIEERCLQLRSLSY